MKLLQKPIKFVLVLLLNLVSKLFTLKLRSKFTSYRNWLNTLWIQNFLGSIGKGSVIGCGCGLEGWGNKGIVIGNYTSIGKNSILGAWREYNDKEYNPTIKIGNNCSIGEYNHITSCDSVVVGDGVLTGRFVYISDKTLYNR